jgi:uncharacterized BrkB/YihY/UPF0761 family membrane protein
MLYPIANLTINSRKEMTKVNYIGTSLSIFIALIIYLVVLNFSYMNGKSEEEYLKHEQLTITMIYYNYPTLFSVPLFICLFFYMQITGLVSSFLG